VYMEPRSISSAENWKPPANGDRGYCEAVGEPIIGRGGIGGTKWDGVGGPERLVTPGMYAIWMTFDARVRTVDAIEATVWVDA